MARLPLRSDLVLALACLGLYIGAAAQVRTGSQTALRVSLLALSQPLLRGVDRVVYLVRDAAAGRQDWRATLAELQRLRGELEAVKRENYLLLSELSALRQGNTLLAAYPSLRPRAVLATVIARDIFGSHTIILDKGRTHGLSRDCPVLAAGGVLGRIDYLWDTQARVQLFSHPAAAAAAEVIGVPGEALLVGGESPHLEGLPPYTQIPPQTPVVTTGSEGIYPPGLMLGVTGESRVGGLFTVVSVTLSARPEKALVVLVLRKGSA